MKCQELCSNCSKELTSCKYWQRRATSGCQLSLEPSRSEDSRVALPTHPGHQEWQVGCCCQDGAQVRRNWSARQVLHLIILNRDSKMFMSRQKSAKSLQGLAQ